MDGEAPERGPKARAPSTSLVNEAEPAELHTEDDVGLPEGTTRAVGLPEGLAGASDVGLPEGPTGDDPLLGLGGEHSLAALARPVRRQP